MSDERWYMMARDGRATLCADRADAEHEARNADTAWPAMGPHRAVQLVEAGFDAADMATAAAQGFRDGVASVSAQAADRAIENCPELNMGNYDAVGVERLNDWAIRAHDEIDRLHALAAGQATAAPAQPAAQPAGTQRPGDERAAFEQWSEVTNQGYDLARNVSGKLQTFESTETEHAWRGFFHGLSASHGQAPAKSDPAYSVACHLATALFKKHFAHLPDFASGQAVWGLCGSTAGVISQIDNMVSGLLQPPTTAFSEDEL